MKFNDSIQSSLDLAWHRQSAESSLERWFEVCDKEHWNSIPEDMTSLIRVFGASWYFTRFVFYRGKHAAILIDKADQQSFDMDIIVSVLHAATEADDLEQKLERLRLLKNEIMLQILVCYLSARFNQQQTEQALTNLADATLFTIMSIFDLHSVVDCRSAALGMGRMAGDEMTFGSDLDLIFLFETELDESTAELSRKIRLLLRYLSAASSAGSLYEVDMRLRPHGTSGALLTSTRSFLEYHQADREIWERQMMTRCRPVTSESSLASETLEQIMPYVYAEYDEEYLRDEVVAMRIRVQVEKGSPTGKKDIKRGSGGLMDIDFLTHFLQLNYGHKYPELITGSTREALNLLAARNIITKQAQASLIGSYNFLKQIEACVRLFDMKPVSTISDTPEANQAVAVAMGFQDDTHGFMQEYFSITKSVRDHFIEIVGEPG